MLYRVAATFSLQQSQHLARDEGARQHDREEQRDTEHCNPKTDARCERIRIWIGLVDHVTLPFWAGGRSPIGLSADDAYGTDPRPVM